MILFPFSIAGGAANKFSDAAQDTYDLAYRVMSMQGAPAETCHSEAMKKVAQQYTLKSGVWC